MKNSSIKDYFKGKNVFIIGGSGFIGKAFIEKLLRSCSDIGKIYILLRPKKGKELYERVEQIVSSPLFNSLTSKNPDSLKKIIPIKGDTCQLGLVISAIEEPFQGWIDNFNGPVGLLVAGASALLRILYADPEIMTDYNPVDNTVKSMIVSAWHKANFGDINELSIYHQTKNDAMPFKLRQFLEQGRKLCWDVPFEQKIWFPRHKTTTCFYEYYIVILFHMIPAILLDLALRVAGYPPMMYYMDVKIRTIFFVLVAWLFFIEINVPAKLWNVTYDY